MQRHPDIVLAAVYAVPDPVVGDQVMAAVQLRPGVDALDGDKLADFLAAQEDLGTKWAPRFVRHDPGAPRDRHQQGAQARTACRAVELRRTGAVAVRKGGPYRRLGEAEAAASNGPWRTGFSQCRRDDSTAGRLTANGPVVASWTR